MSFNHQVTYPWRYQLELCDKQIRRYRLFQHDAPLTYREVIGLWQTSRAFRDFYRAILAGSDFEAFFWELPPVSLTLLDRAFEFVLVESVVLAKAVADSRDFAEHFMNSTEQVVEFQNLGRDAWLLVPTPPPSGEDRLVGDSFEENRFEKNGAEQNSLGACAHLASFCRQADSVQQDQLWQQLGFMLEREINFQPLWLSSCGLGVYWLHLRLDQRPKYYNYQPYKQGHC